MSGLPPIGVLMDDDFEDNDRRRIERERPEPELRFLADDAEMLPESQRSKATMSLEELERFQSSEGAAVRTTFDEAGNPTKTEEVDDELKTHVRDLLEAVRSLPEDIVAALRSS